VAQIARGEIWLADLNPSREHEQAGKHPCLIISVDRFPRPELFTFLEVLVLNLLLGKACRFENLK
jgi:mRNA-degrading endonuclease toxin of MazEF toxin-antitoxin module